MESKLTNRRMFSSDIIQSDTFINLSVETRLLYFYIMGNADDYGFAKGLKSSLILTESNDSNLQELIDANYLIQFESKVCVVTHWQLQNRIAENIKSPTIYKDEFDQLEVIDKVYVRKSK